MDLGLKGKLALVTGASRGIGRGIAMELAREGCRVIVAARDAEKLKDAAKALPGSGHRAVNLDLMADDGPARLVKAVQEEAPAPDILVHNLGGSLGVTDALAGSADWQKVWRYNLGIAVDLNRAFLPAMIEKKAGRVIHLSTLSTVTYNGYAPYVCAKAAVDAYVKALGREMARHGVIVSAVAPGAIYIEGRFFTKLQKENPQAMAQYYKDHLPAGRLGTPEEVGAMVAYLSSDRASFMTGSIVSLDGGGM